MAGLIMIDQLDHAIAKPGSSTGDRRRIGQIEEEQDERDAKRTRRSARRADPQEKSIEAFSRIAEFLKTGRKVTFITGAGLSVASGIPPFRGSQDAVWAESVIEWGTKKKFLENPGEWFEQFFCRHFDNSIFDGKEPNRGHRAISEICSHFHDQVKVITQNIDRLHSHSTYPIAPSQLIEIHGAVGGFKCFTEGCAYASEIVLNECMFHIDEQTTEKHNVLTKSPEKLPSCPDCRARMCANTLLFDEQYSDHKSYRFDEALEWLEESDLIVFVGTSFSVSITDIALDILKENNNSCDKLTINFNIENNLPNTKSHFVDSRFVPGKCEETLSQLAKYLGL